MTPWTAAEASALSSGAVRYGIFFLLRTDPEVRMWAGIGDCEGEVNAIDATSQIYRGAGTLQDIPAIQSMINGKSERISFVLSGVDKKVIDLARDEQNIVKGKSVHLGFGLFTPEWSSLVGPIRWAWRGRADYMQEKFDIPDGNSDRFSRSVELSVGSVFTARKRPQYSFFTNTDQQARHPGDKFCERTPNYTQEYTKKFGPL